MTEWIVDWNCRKPAEQENTRRGNIRKHGKLEI